MARIPNINPVVAATSPGIYDALQSSGASQQDINAAEQVSFAYQKGLELRKLPMNVAHEEFGKLSKPAQESLRGLFGNDPYLQAPQSFLQKVEGAAKNVVKFAISPIAAAMSQAGNYSKALATIPRVAIEAGQTKPDVSVEGAAPKPMSIFSAKTWSTAYSGKDLYREDALDTLRTKYGKANIAVATGLVAGKTPAEIMQESGTTYDPAIGNAIAASLNDKNFQGIINEVKEARISVGRSAASKIANYVERPDHNGGSIIAKIGADLFGPRKGPLVYKVVGQSDEDYKKQLDQANLAYRKRISGPIDAIYGIVTDPLTWATGGGDKAATLGVKLQQSILSAAKEGRLAEGVAGAFEKPQVSSLWDQQIGPALKKFADATTDGERAQAREGIRIAAPSMDNLEFIRTMIKPGPGLKPVTDAKTAQKFFSEAENVHMLLGGRIDGTNFYRNGIPTALNNRIFDQGKVKAIDAIFNPSLQNLDAQQLLAKETKVNDAWKILTKLGPTENDGVSQDLGKIKDLIDETTRTQRLAYKLGTIFAKSPGRGAILYGNDAWKTINTFENVARLVVPRDMARIMAQKFLQSPEDEQLVAVRNLYAAYMQKQGLEGSVRGREIMQSQLEKTFANVNGMGASATTEVPQHMANVFSKYAVNWENDVPIIANGGAHIPSQLTDAVAPLDYLAINKGRALSRDISVIGLLDKASQSDFLNKVTNLWSFFTLIPRLGIRSASDEFFFYLFQQPAADVMRFILGGGRKEANVLTMFTGSKDSVGPLKRSFNKVFRNGGPEDYMTLDRWSSMIDDIAKDLSKDGATTVTPEEINHVLIREKVAQRLWDVEFNGISNENKEAIINALKYNPDFLNGTINALTARTSLNGKFADEEFLNPFFTPSQVDKAMADVGERTFGKPIEAGHRYYNVSETDLKKKAQEFLGGERPWWNNLTEKEQQKEIEKFVALAHFDNWNIRFGFNKVNLIDNHVFNPVPAFLDNGALKTSDQVESAVQALMKDIGVNYGGPEQLTHSVRDPKLLDSFNHKFSDTVSLRDRGLDDVEIARVHINTMLADMYTAFHGNAKAFNQDLYNHIRMAFEDSFEGETKSVPSYKRWEVAARKMTFEDFQDLTLGKHPTLGGINTRIVIPGVAGNEIEGWFKQFGNFAFEQMDRQINGLFRQRAVTITYARLYNANKPLMKEFANKQAKLMLEESPFLTEKEAFARANELAEKRFTEISMQDAVNTILKYSDNPDIRSNLSVAGSTVGRFYRANEDFQRRAYRTFKDAPLRTFYRMRLLHTGLSASGSVYTDPNGSQYVTFPTDSVLFAPISKVMSAFYGPNATNKYASPQFDEIKMKLSLINPSFSQDAGEPMLSGPAAALSIWGVKSLLDALPSSAQPEAFKAGQMLNSLALGSIGNNITFRKAIVPMFLDNIYQMLNPNDKSREAITAFTQAVDYATAYGHGLPSNPTVQQKADFRDNMRIGAHSILFMRGLLGMISPITPTLEESKGVPSYYKEQGIASLRGEFFKILEGIKNVYGPDIQDPYALATAIFVGQNPGKSIYTVSRSNKNYHVLLTANNNMQNWAVENKDFIAKYGDAALVFAPQIGKFNSDVYNWMQSQDMATLPSIDAYLDNVALASAKADYFKISQEEKAALTSNSDLDTRKQIIDNAKQLRESLFAQNPALQGELGGESGLTKSRDAQTLQSLKELVSIPNAPISSKDKVNMTAAVKIVDGFINVVTNPQFQGSSNFGEIKLQERADTETKLDQLSKLSPAVAEAYKYVFMGILNQYVPDKNVVLSKGN